MMIIIISTVKLNQLMSYSKVIVLFNYIFQLSLLVLLTVIIS